MPIHQTLTDSEGNKYKVVSANWLKTTVIIMGLNFFCLVGVTALLIDTVHDVDQSTRYNDIWVQRSRAMDELHLKRAEVEQWTYHNLCDYVMKPKGLDCLANPQWWASPDRDKYNLIIDNPSGSGIFPKPQGEK